MTSNIDISNISETALSMSSLEIAELTGKEHRNVLRDIRNMLTELYGQDHPLRFEQMVTRPNPSGGAAIPSTVFMLPKRETLILVSGYSVKARARIIDRWLELEQVTAKVSTRSDDEFTLSLMKATEALLNVLPGLLSRIPVQTPLTTPSTQAASPAPAQPAAPDKYLTLRQLSDHFRCSEHLANSALRRAGLHTKIEAGKRFLTDLGTQYGKYSGSSIIWKESVLPYLRNYVR